MAKKQKTETAPHADVPAPTNSPESAPVAVAETPTNPKRKKAPKPEPTATLAAIFAGYLASLDKRGSSSGTIASYRMELDMAGKALGIDTPIANLTDTQVAAVAGHVK
jgi:hypothetical protein